ncbi:MAG: MobA/MobL family protein [Chloroflexota bacterium]|nr:MobA/MobL family protein [Chloroflexota bacterium]
MRGYVREQFTSRGMVADVAIHRGASTTHTPT